MRYTCDATSAVLGVHERIGSNVVLQRISTQKHCVVLTKSRNISLLQAWRGNAMAVNTQDPYAPDHDDHDPEETAEWIESLDGVVETSGSGRGREIMTSLLQRSRELHLSVPQVPTTDYVNSISSEDAPDFPGDEELERQY